MEPYCIRHRESPDRCCMIPWIGFGSRQIMQRFKVLQRPQRA
ncbi:hypothetical protein AB395_00004065 [Sinorhizobium fredii CCBAU 45436]|nr:hypothetical protein SF83666_c38560 [Sinorhizobium fredii CCBAU 83666]AWI59689.1 hypothetical protein AB395_00004065 [Sinorhizobium fredii CCBAU 45436]